MSAKLRAGEPPRGDLPLLRDRRLHRLVVITPYGEIPWNRLSRISDAEMKVLMIDVVDRVFTYLRYPEELARIGGAARWDRPKLHPDMMRAIRRRRSRMRRTT